MADEDVTQISATSRTPRRNADRRIPRFSWNPAYEDTFFRSLCESMQLGYKDSHNFKAGAWERAAVALRDRHGAYPEKSHLINKADNARKKFRMWRGLREDPDFLYNPVTRIVTASEEVWNRHFEKEPLSKALRGRPFDHENYMEILFPDVVGSGGAPKRIMKPRRRNPDGSMPPRQGDADASTVDPIPDDLSPTSSASSSASTSPALYHQNSSQNQFQSIQPATTQQQPTTTPTNPPQTSPQRPNSTTIPPRPSIGSSASNALTPPDETTPNTQSLKRPHPDQTSGGSERRRGRPSRFSASFYTQPNTTGTPSAPAAAAGTAASSSTPSNQQLTQPQQQLQLQPPPLTPHQSPSSNNHPSPELLENGILSLAEALRARTTPKWPEQALEILFRDFAEEDLDLQLKIAEKALTDDNKAMVFVKMTPVLRRHWVSRLREAHMRNLGSGRVGEEAS